MTQESLSLPRSYAQIWLQALRAYSFPASVIPVGVGAVWAFRSPGEVLGYLFPVVLVAAVAYHAGTNLINDYVDFQKAVDQKDTLGSSRVLVDGLLPPKAVFLAGLLAFAIGTALGGILLVFRGWPIFTLGVIGLLGGYLYSGGPKGYKYLALGDILVFLLMGPLMVIGSHLALKGNYGWDLVIVSLPVGFLVTAILHVNNLRDLRDDQKAKIRTFALLLGHRLSQVFYFALVLGAYTSVLGMALTGFLSWWGLLPWLSWPVAIGLLRKVARSREGHSAEDLVGSVERTAQLHLLFGLLYTAGIALR